jgi:hypothetical protein
VAENCRPLQFIEALLWKKPTLKIQISATATMFPIAGCGLLDLPLIPIGGELTVMR